MASEAKKAKAESTPKKESPAADAPKSTDASKTVDAPSEKAGSAPKNYSRGEGQKAVTQAYKDNWNAIFAKKKKR